MAGPVLNHPLQNDAGMADGNPPARRRVSILGIIGMCAGLLAVVLFQKTELLGFPLMVAGLGLSIAGLAIGKKRGERIGFAIAGIAISCVPLIVNIVIGTVLGSAFGDTPNVIISQVLPFV